MWRFLTLIVLCVLLQANLHSQEESKPTLETDPNHHLGVDASFNAHDVFVGVVFHYANPFGEGFSLIGSITFRPYGKEILVQESPGVYLYLREERVSILLGLERQLFLTHQFSAFINLLGGVTIPNFRGTERGGVNGMFPVISVGIQWSIPSGKYFAGDKVALRFGQQYINLSEDQYRGDVSILVAL